MTKADVSQMEVGRHMMKRKNNKWSVTVLISDVGNGDWDSIGTGVAVGSLSDLSLGFGVASVLQVSLLLGNDSISGFIAEIITLSLTNMTNKSSTYRRIFGIKSVIWRFEKTAG